MASTNGIHDFAERLDILSPAASEIFKSCVFMSGRLSGTNFLDPLLGPMLIHTAAALGQ